LKLKLKQEDLAPTLKSLSVEQQNAVKTAANAIKDALPNAPEGIDAIANHEVVDPAANANADTPAEGEAEGAKEEEVTERPIPPSDAAEMLKGIAQSSAIKVYKLDAENSVLIDMGIESIIFSDTNIKITNTDQPNISPENLKMEDIGFSKMEVSCMSNGAPTLCKGEEYMGINDKFKTLFEPIKDTVSQFNYILESEFGEIPYLVVFETSEKAMDFKLYTLYLYLKNVNRVRRFALDIPADGIVEIDNNGNMLTLTYKDVDTEEEKVDTIPISGVINYKQVPGSDGLKNMMKIEYMLQVDEEKKVMKSVTLKVKKQTQDADDLAAGMRFYKALDSAVNI